MEELQARLQRIASEVSDISAMADSLFDTFKNADMAAKEADKEIKRARESLAMVYANKDA